MKKQKLQRRTPPTPHKESQSAFQRRILAHARAALNSDPQPDYDAAKAVLSGELPQLENPPK